MKKDSKNRVLNTFIAVSHEQEFKLSWLEQTSYIHKYILTHSNNTEIVDPVVETLNSGFILSGSLRIGNNSESVYIQELRIEINEVKKPIETEKTEWGTIQTPQTCSWQVKTIQETLKLSENLIIGPIPQTWENSSLYFVISATITP